MSRRWFLYLFAVVFAGNATAADASGQVRTRPDVVWVEGTVRDEAGQPVGGASVYARVTYDGSLRNYDLVRKTTSNADGSYAIEGPDGLSFYSAMLVAHVPGRPAAFGWPRLPRGGRDFLGQLMPVPPAKPAKVDVIVPTCGGALEVQVFSDGLPAANVGVALRLQQCDAFDSWGLGAQRPEREELLAISRPVQRTDADGIARFEALVPGVYAIFAGSDESTALNFSNYNSYFPFAVMGSVPLIGEARNIPVRTRETTVHRLGMRPHAAQVKFNVLRDGQNWLAEERLQLIAHRMHGDSSEHTYGVPFNAERTDTYRVATFGLKRIRFVKRSDTGSSRREFPFDEAQAIIAVSPRLASDLPITITARQNRGGSVLVRMVDSAGQPLEGVARFGNGRFHDVAKEGVRISGLEPQTGLVEGRPAGVKQLFPNRKWGEMPPEEELTDRSEHLLQLVTVRENEDVEVTLWPEKVGYVRGRVLVPEGRSPVEYGVSLGRIDPPTGAGVFYRPDKGEFLAGPFRTGTVSLTVAWNGRLTNRPITTQSVAVEAGKVSQVELPPPDDNAVPLPLNPGVTGKVVHADGSPAWMAAVATFHPELARYPQFQQPSGAGTTDVQATILPRSFWASSRDERVRDDGTPREPVAIAWLPGHVGATIVPLPSNAEAPLQFTVPESIIVRGKAAIAGEEPLIDRGTVVVRAQHQGRGRLDNLLSIETTASFDGAFELAGLTPGTYRVQAALDGIWLSPSVFITVGLEPVVPVRLTIPPPGGPVLVSLSPAPPPDRPVKLTVDRPAGPLRDRLWPEFLTPDGAGIVWIPALEAGRHTIRVGDVRSEVEVPPLAESGAMPVETTLAIGGNP